MISIKEARSQAYIQALRDKKQSITGEIVLKHSPEQLWPVISNTDQINAMAKLAPVIVSTRPFEYGGSEISVETKDLGLTLLYEEFPYEWEKNNCLKVERVYRKGITSYASFEVHLTHLETGQTRVQVQISLVPKIPFLLVRPKIQSILNRIIEAYKKADQRLIENTHASIQAFLSEAKTHESQINELLNRWGEVSPNTHLCRSIARYVYTAPDFLLQKIRPFELAQLYEIDPKETLYFFLRATKNGDFNMSWDILCPSCKGSKSRSSHLKDVDLEVHCETCGIDYSAKFDENFELTFYPAPQTKEISLATFCAGSPANTAHIAHQHNLFPKDQMAVILNLPEGRYTFRTLTAQGSLVFEVSAEGRETFELDLESHFEALPGLTLQPGCQLTLNNPQDFFQTLKIDSLAWKENCVTAAYVTGLQEFRDLFGSEVLRPGIQLAVSNLVFMFTDLKDSTKMYETEGDAAAFNVVQQHFDLILGIIDNYQGAIVKTIGDAVMGVFQTSLNAVQCGVKIQEAFTHWSKTTAPHPVIVKMGIHRGPSIALNLNERLDYFGSTINKAARIQGESIGQDIVISQEILDDKGVASFLESFVCPQESVSSELKGIEGSTELIRLWPDLS